MVVIKRDGRETIFAKGKIYKAIMSAFQEVEEATIPLALERLKGHLRFGYVKLLKTERSETAAMADLLD